ncbi:MAG TPA: hypothetical protein PKV84_06775 [Candidatus Omnitrophota bacterium]|nr:hypothetical protein [Candidatus Omnitrophota bacterium]
MKKILSLAVVLSMLLAPMAFATPSAWTEEKNYGDRVSGKLQFGLANTLLGWIDLFAEPNKFANEGKNVWSGVGKGMVDSVVNTVGGAIHLVTFPVPADLPLPDGGVDLGGK